MKLTSLREILEVYMGDMTESAILSVAQGWWIVNRKALFVEVSEREMSALRERVENFSENLCLLCEKSEKITEKSRKMIQIVGRNVILFLSNVLKKLSDCDTLYV